MTPPSGHRRRDQLFGRGARRRDDHELCARSRLLRVADRDWIYVDYLALYKPGFIDEILVSVVHDTDPTFLALALTLMAIPILMTVLSTTLPARINRAVNLVVATLYIPVSMYNVAGEAWAYSCFYGLSIGLEVLLLAVILGVAWTWPRTTRATAGHGLS